MTNLEAVWEINENPLDYENKVLHDALANGDIDLALSALQRISEYQKELIEALYLELNKSKKSFIGKLVDFFA